MKNSIFKKSAWRLPIAMVLSSLMVGCGKPAGNLFSAENQGLAEGGSLTETEEALASDSNYVTQETKVSLQEQKFNHQQWPKPCSEDDVKDKACKSTKEKTGPRSIRISGLVLILDPTKSPWDKLNNQLGIRELIIEADKIVVRGELSFPSTQVKLHAPAIVFEENGVINTTPVTEYGHPTFKEGMTKALDGNDGIKGSSIFLEASKLTVLGDQSKTRLIADGGRGQKAGDGWGFLPKDLEVPNSTNTAGGFAQIGGHEPGVIFVSGYCSGELNRSCDNFGAPDGVQFCQYSDIMNGPAGVQKRPSDGRHAIAGGHPGAGGVGGMVVMSIKEGDVPHAFGRAQAGLAGELSPDLLGQKGGLPSLSYHKMVSYGCRGDGEPKVARRVALVPHQSKDGNPATSPKSPIHQNADGRVGNLPPFANFDRSQAFLNLKVRYIQNLYFNRSFQEVLNQINDLESTMTDEKGIVQMPAVTSVQLMKMKQSLLSNKDYFGRGLKDAPSYTVEFGADRYRNQVAMAMKTYFLSRLFSQEYQTRQEQIAKITAHMSDLEENIRESMDQIEMSDTNISSLTAQVQSVRDNEESIRGLLAVLKERIVQAAKDEQRRRDSLKKFYKFAGMVSQICQAFPFGQPVLGMAGKLGRTIIEMPKDGGKNITFERAKETYEQFSQLKKASVSDEDQAKWKEYKEKMDPRNFRQKNSEEKKEYLGFLAGQASNAVSAMTEIANEADAPRVPADELETIIRQMELENPEFQNVTKLLQELVDQKLKLANDVHQFTALVESLTVKMSAYVATSSFLSQASLEMQLVDDSMLKSLFEQMAQEQERQLLYLYDEAVRSYEYQTLTKFERRMDLMGLQGKVFEILKEEKDLDYATRALRDFYESQLAPLSQSLINQLDSRKVLQPREGSKEFDLSKRALQELAASGRTSISLTPDFYANKTNVRIRGIHVIDQTDVVTSVGKTKVENGNYALVVNFRLGQLGSFNTTPKVEYIYPDNNLNEWEHTFQWNGNRWVGQANPIARDFKGLLTMLVGDKSLVENSEIFSAHAGITDLKIRTRSKGPYVLKRLKIRVDYIYNTQ